MLSRSVSSVMLALFLTGCRGSSVGAPAETMDGAVDAGAQEREAGERADADELGGAAGMTTADSSAVGNDASDASGVYGTDAAGDAGVFDSSGLPDTPDDASSASDAQSDSLDCDTSSCPTEVVGGCPNGYTMLDVPMSPGEHNGSVVDGSWSAETVACGSGCEYHTWYVVLSNGSFLQYIRDDIQSGHWFKWADGVTSVELAGSQLGMVYAQRGELRFLVDGTISTYEAPPKGLSLLSVIAYNPENSGAIMSDHAFYRPTTNGWQKTRLNVYSNEIATEYLASEAVWGPTSSARYFLEYAGSRILAFLGHQDRHAFVTYSDQRTPVIGVTDIASCFHENPEGAPPSCVGFRQATNQIRVWRGFSSFSADGVVTFIHTAPSDVTIADLTRVEYRTASGWRGDYITTNREWRSFFCWMPS